MGRMAYWREAGPQLACSSLGDANRGGFLATVTAVSNLEGPAAPTPRAAGLSVLPAAQAGGRPSPVAAAATPAGRAFFFCPPLMRVGGPRPSTLRQTPRGGPFC